MPEEIKIPISAPGAEQAAASVGKFSGMFGGLANSTRTARGALHEFHGVAHVITSLMEGNLTGAIRGAGIAMRGLAHLAMSPVIMSVSILAAGVYALSRAWSNHTEEVKKQTEAYRALNEQMERRKAAAAPERFTETGKVKHEAEVAAAAGDAGKLQEMQDEYQRKLIADNVKITEDSSPDSRLGKRTQIAARRQLNIDKRVAQVEETRAGKNQAFPLWGEFEHLAAKIVQGNVHKEYESVVAAQNSEIVMDAEKKQRDIEVLEKIHEELVRLNGGAVQ